MEIITNLLVPEFGVGEGSPTGLAWHDGGLYMVGQSNAVLYTLNPANGMAYTVSGPIQPGFGVDSCCPVDITSHEGGLYMVDSSKPCLYLLDTGTGSATVAPDDLPIGNAKPMGIASHNGKLYVVTWPKVGVTKTNTSATLYELEVTLQNSVPHIGETMSKPLINASNPSGLFSSGAALMLGRQSIGDIGEHHFYPMNIEAVSLGAAMVIPASMQVSRMDFYNGLLYGIGPDTYTCVAVDAPPQRST